MTPAMKSMTDRKQPDRAKVRATTVARLLTIRDVADRLQVSVRTVNRLIALGKLKVKRIGRSVRITEGALQAALTEAEGD